MAASRSSQQNARELFELKQKAVQFYRENQVPEKLEEILNAMVYEQPPDVYGRLAAYFQSISKPPVVSKVEACQVLDSKGQPNIQADIYCTVCGVEKLTSSSTMASFNHLLDSAPLDLRESDEKEQQESVSAAIEFIRSPITNGLAGLQPMQQKEADQILCSIISDLKKAKEESDKEKTVEIVDELADESAKTDTAKVLSPPTKGKKKSGSAKSAMIIVQEPREKMFSGCNAVCVVSQGIAKAAAEVQGIPLYEHIGALYQDEPPYQFSLPIPMVTTLCSGKASPGKQNLIKEVLLIPKSDFPFRESMEKLTQVYHQVNKIQFAKVGVAAHLTNDFGSMCPQYDKPDQLLDHVNEALLALGLTTGEDLFIGLNCAAHEIFDYDKGKYEITTGAMKNAEDMVDVYGDIIARYPGVIVLIDPLRKQDVNAYNRLCAQYSEKCVIMGDHVYQRPEKFLLTRFDDLQLNGATLKLQQMTSVTDVLKVARVLHDTDSLSIVSGVQGDTNDAFLADLAIGIQATFVRFGAPCRGERVAQYNRLCKIADELASRDALITRSEFPFRAIHQPEPQEDQSVESEGKKGD